MGDVVGITGGMGGNLSGPSLGGGADPGSMIDRSGQVALEVGVMVDKIAFHVHSPDAEVKLPVIVSFDFAEAYQVIAAIEAAIAHIRKR